MRSKRLDKRRRKDQQEKAKKVIILSAIILILSISTFFIVADKLGIITLSLLSETEDFAEGAIEEPSEDVESDQEQDPASEGEQAEDEVESSSENQDDTTDPQEEEDQEGSSENQDANDNQQGEEEQDDEQEAPPSKDDAPPVEEDDSKEKEEEPEQEEEEKTQEEPISYYPASSSPRVGPIISSLGVPSSSPSKVVIPQCEDGEYKNPVDGLNLTKTASVLKDFGADDRQIFKLDLTATTDSEIEYSIVPSDIILVLDRSGSMKDHINHNITKMEALKEAASNFVDKVRQESKDSKIAVVSFSSHHDGATSVTTDIELTRVEGNVSSIKSAINSLYARGGTYANKGMGRAKEIFQGYTAPDRNRVVILFTDGEPGEQGFTNALGFRYAAATINQAAVLKGELGTRVTSDVSFNDYHARDIYEPRIAYNQSAAGATVYSIGVFPSGVSNWAHRYMAWVSSDNDNSQTARSSDGYHYYFTADSPESLNKIFQEIAEETGKTIENVVIKDYIDPRFDIVNANGEKLQVGAEISISGSETGTIKEDSNGIYVEWTKARLLPGSLNEGKGFKGSLYINPKDEFIGGNNIPTNLPNITALYSGGENLGSFPYPLVNVPFRLHLKDIQDTIFLGEGIPQDKGTAQGEMVQEDFVSYDYPNGMLTYSWSPDFSKGDKINDTTNFQLTVTATPKKYIPTPIEFPYQGAVGKEATSLNKQGNYKVVVKKGTLTITKIIQDPVYEHDPDQTFVFRINQYKDTAKTDLVKTFYETIRVDSSSNSRKIIDLPKGCYEVIEKLDWSWQYEPVGSTTAQDTLGMKTDGTRDIEKDSAQVSYTNKTKFVKWLRSIDWVINLFTGGRG